jgi:hypothetical protein
VSVSRELGALVEGREAAEAEMLPHYSRALDEIYRLRRALAYEAAVTAAHLDLKSFPKSRRKAAEGQVRRMRAAARGNGREAYDASPLWALKSALLDAGADPGLTRQQWEAAAPPSSVDEGNPDR